MCLVVLAVKQHPDYPVVLAANRDEFHARPTKEAHWWPDEPDILGGRDLQAGGTWLALHRSGRFATVTNYRDAKPPSPKHRSRGHLVTDFLESELTPLDYLETVREDAYAGFNLIVGDHEDVAYLSNREEGNRCLDSGTYGLSNALLDGPWHKVESTRDRLVSLITEPGLNETSLMRLMSNREKAPVSEVDKGHLDFATAHEITAPFIVMPNYGTRCTTILLADKNGKWHFTERRYNPAGTTLGHSRFTFAAGT